jgi:hypothetical protein
MGQPKSIEVNKKPGVIPFISSLIKVFFLRVKRLTTKLNLKAGKNTITGLKFFLKKLQKFGLRIHV